MLGLSACLQRTQHCKSPTSRHTQVVSGIIFTLQIDNFISRPSRRNIFFLEQPLPCFVLPSRFPVACQALARLVERGAALLEQQLVASICALGPWLRLCDVGSAA